MTWTNPACAVSRGPRPARSRPAKRTRPHHGKSPDTARKSAGNARYDVLQQTARTNHFTVVEVWKDQAAADAHELAAHTKAYRGEVGPMLGALYDQRWYKAL